MLGVRLQRFTFFRVIKRARMDRTYYDAEQAGKRLNVKNNVKESFSIVQADYHGLLSYATVKTKQFDINIDSFR